MWDYPLLIGKLIEMKKLLSIYLFLGLTSVVLGAFAAHSLKGLISTDQINTFQIGVRYQFLHVFAALFAYLYYQKKPVKLIRMACWLFLLGIIFFSGSLYLLACRTVLDIEHWSFLGPLTPLGGFCFITGWLLLFIVSLRE